MKTFVTLGVLIGIMVFSFELGVYSKTVHDQWTAKRTGCSAPTQLRVVQMEYPGGRKTQMLACL